jgi:hypothetical protein
MGYTNYSNLYFAIVGSRGDIKSPAMDCHTTTTRLWQYQLNEHKRIKLTTPVMSSKKTIVLQDATIESALCAS